MYHTFIIHSSFGRIIQHETGTGVLWGSGGHGRGKNEEF